MRNIEINLADVKSFDEFHDLIREKLNFPEYYGRNLDAMHDCLTDIVDDVEVFFTGVKECREVSPEMNAYMDGLERMLKDTSNQCDNLTFIMLADGEEDGVTRNMPSFNEDDEDRILCEGYAGAIAATLHELGIGEGDCVFASAFAGPEVAEAISAAGAKFVPVDIAPDNYSIDPRMLDIALEEIKEDDVLTPSAVIISNTFGIPQKMEVIDTIAEENGLDIIFEGEDELSEEEAEYIGRIGDAYRMAFRTRFGMGSSRVWLTRIPINVKPVWNAFPIRFPDPEKREEVYNYLRERGIDVKLPELGVEGDGWKAASVGKRLAKSTLVLPVSVDMKGKDIVRVVDGIWEFFGRPEPEDERNPFAGLAENHMEYGIR